MRAACCVGVALFATAVSAALASPARGADGTVASAPPSVLKIASSPTIAPDVPDTPDNADVSTPADETPVPADVETPVVTPEIPAKLDGWVEMKPKVIPVRVAVVAHLHTWRARSTTPEAVTQRPTAQYHPRTRQYHRRAAKVQVPARSSSALASTQGALSRATDEPPIGPPTGDDICASQPPNCPDVCSDDSVQNSLQNVAEIVRCIVNSALGELGNSDAGSAPDTGLATPAPPAESDPNGQYQCEDVRYHDPACDSVPPAGSPAPPPTSTPTPDAAPVAPPSGITASPPAPSGAAPSGTGSPPVRPATPSNAADGWVLVHEPREQQPVAHAIVAAPRAPERRVLQPTHAVIRQVRAPARPDVQPQNQSPVLAGHPRVALATAARPSSGSDAGEGPFRTAVALLALASLSLALLAVVRAYGDGTAVALRTRLGSKGLSATRRGRADDERGIRYRG